MKRYEGKVCLVTGGTRGIGLAIALRFAQEGGIVVIVSRRKKNVEAAHALIAKAGTVVSYIANFGKPEERMRVREDIEKKYGRLDVLVSNIAASLHVGKSIDISEKAYDKMFDVNVKSAFFLIKEYHSLLCKAKTQASVLIVSSIAGYRADPPIGIYGVTKTALLGLTKLLATELKEDNIRVNGLAPGPIKTDFLGPLKDALEENGTAVGIPEDMAGAAAFACADEAKFMIGETLVLSGGQHVRL